MATTIAHGKGRLCNQVIRSLAVSLLAKKHNLHVQYQHSGLITDKLGIQLFVGENRYNETKKVGESEYLDVLNQNDIIKHNVDLYNGYYQSTKITDMIYEHLHTDEQKNSIMMHNQYKERYNNNNDLFVHIRLTDAERFNPGIKYYLNAIGSVSFENLYIGSDNFNHPMIAHIQKHYPNAVLLRYNPIETIQFASTCKHIILSNGSFSAVIGYLAFFSSTIFYPEYGATGNGWCPMGMFRNKNWKAIEV